MIEKHESLRKDFFRVGWREILDKIITEKEIRQVYRMIECVIICLWFLWFDLIVWGTASSDDNDIIGWFYIWEDFVYSLRFYLAVKTGYYDNFSQLVWKYPSQFSFIIKFNCDKRDNFIHGYDSTTLTSTTLVVKIKTNVPEVSSINYLRCKRWMKWNIVDISGAFYL